MGTASTGDGSEEPFCRVLHNYCLPTESSSERSWSSIIDEFASFIKINRDEEPNLACPSEAISTSLHLHALHTVTRWSNFCPQIHTGTLGVLTRPGHHLVMSSDRLELLTTRSAERDSLALRIQSWPRNKGR